MYVTSPPFREALGTFYGTWASVEITMDWAIGKFLGLPHEETHLITAGLEFGRKAILLRALVARSDRKNKGEIIKHIKTIQEDSKRNIFAHSFMRSEEKRAIFVERSNHGKFSVKKHEFEPESFIAHVRQFIESAKLLEQELGLTREEIQAFADAADSLAKKP
jgi:hypothetical protein